MTTETEKLAIRVGELRDEYRRRMDIVSNAQSDVETAYHAYHEAERVYRAALDAEKEQRRLQPGGTMA